MSTEIPESSEMARKKSKHKKNKGHTDNNTKKRKREEQEVEPKPVPGSQSEERSSKKHKREKGEKNAVPDSQPAQQPTKKRKHKQMEAEERHAVMESQPEQRHSKKKHNEHHKPATRPPKSEKDRLEEHSPFIQQTTSFYLPLSPCAYRFPLEGLCAEHISPLLLTYFPRLNGVVLSYENPRMSEHSGEGLEVKKCRDPIFAKSIDEYAVTWVWLTAEFLIFRPRRGTYLEGHVNLQNESILGLVCYNYFNAVIEREKLPQDWKWIEDEDQTEQSTKKERKKAVHGGGYFVDGDGNAIEGELVFKVEDFEATPGGDTGAGTVSIFGTLRLERDNT